MVHLNRAFIQGTTEIVHYIHPLTNRFLHRWQRKKCNGLLFGWIRELEFVSAVVTALNSMVVPHLSNCIHLPRFQLYHLPRIQLAQYLCMSLKYIKYYKTTFNPVIAQMCYTMCIPGSLFYKLSSYNWSSIMLIRIQYGTISVNSNKFTVQ